jgi:hypothetical protein
MSGYTIGEIAGWLTIAAVLGFVLGWLARELVLRASRRTRGESPANKAAAAKKAPARKAPARRVPPPDETSDDT